MRENQPMSHFTYILQRLCIALLVFTKGKIYNAQRRTVQNPCKARIPLDKRRRCIDGNLHFQDHYAAGRPFAVSVWHRVVLLLPGFFIRKAEMIMTKT